MHAQKTQGMKKRALIVVDVQRDFLPGGVIGTQERGIVAIIRRLLSSKQFDLTVASKDWHPRDHVSFARTHSKQPGESITLNGMKYQLFVEHCLQNSQGAQLSADLDLYTFDKVICKGTDQDDECFSAFASVGKRRDTGLTSYLTQHAIQQLYVTGVTLEQCVKQTVQDAIHAGFETTVIVDACAPVDPKAEASTLRELQELGACLTESGKLVQSYQ